MILSICETHLRKNEDIMDIVHQFYEWIDYPRVEGAAWGGTGIFVHRSLQWDDITRKLAPSVESTFIKFSWGGKTFIFGSVYLPQQTPDEIPKFLVL